LVSLQAAAGRLLFLARFVSPKSLSAAVRVD
jgi:hypothetical protein